MARGSAHALMEADEGEDDVADRLRALEAKVQRMERALRPDPVAEAEAAEEWVGAMTEAAEAAAADLVDKAEQRIRAALAAQVAEARAVSEMAADRLAREVREVVAREMRSTERETRLAVSEARVALEAAFSAGVVRAFETGKSYRPGDLVSHGGGFWRQVAAAGSGGEAPSAKAQSWILQADGVAGVETRLDDGALVAEVRMASGKTFKSTMPNAVPTFAGAFVQGRTYRPLEMTHRSGALYMATRATQSDPAHCGDLAAGGWAVAAARGERGPGATSKQLEISESYLLARMGEQGTRRDRVAEVIERADDFWVCSGHRHTGTVIAFGQMAVGGALTVMLGDDVREAGEALGERAAMAALTAAREDRQAGDAALDKAVSAIRTAALSVASPGRPERLVAGLAALPRPDRVLAATLRTMVGAGNA